MEKAVLIKNHIISFFKSPLFALPLESISEGSITCR